MQNALRSRWWRVASVVAILGILTAACAQDDDKDSDAGSSSGGDAKKTLTIAGPETGGNTLYSSPIS